METSSATFQISDEAIAQEVGGELIVLDMATERYLAVDRVGRQIWGLLGEGRTITAVVDEVTTLYGVERARVEQDVAAFVAQLTDLGLGTLSPR